MKNDTRSNNMINKSFFSVASALLILLLSSFSSANAALVCDSYQPVINGCSDWGVNDLNFVTDFGGACNTHDICYQTIGRSQSKCDSDFRRI